SQPSPHALAGRGGACAGGGRRAVAVRTVLSLEGGALKRRVVITGLGLVTPVGHTVGDTWGALMSGRSGVSYIEKFDTTKFSVKIAAEVKGFDPLKFVEKKEARKMGAFIQYAVAASDEAVYDSRLIERGQKIPQAHGEE